MKTQLMILLVLVAALFAAAPGAHAQGCWGDGGWGYGYLYQSLDYNVPYFAAHPPVYYSYPVPRTYGYSPFAYPPNVMTPDVIMDNEQPVEIINPYAPSSQQQSAAPNDDQTAAAAPESTSRDPQPLVIINPYVAGAGSIAKASE
jgi:hypothetical protein